MLDILWTDREQQSLRELNSIMHASQLLFVFKEEALKNHKTGAPNTLAQSTRSVKVFLSSYICDHQIWQEVKVWRLSLQRLINLKFHDAVKAQEKAKEDQEKAKQTVQ